MKILQVIHGYPMRYNAGSEVYTQTLCRGLSERHEVFVFTREENPFLPDFALRAEVDSGDPRIKLFVVNVPNSRDRYRLQGVDRRFAEVLELTCPDIVHVGHQNHLSTSLLSEAANRRIPILYTLHDYWLMCPRGQLMQMFPANPGELWSACDGQEDRKCAERCYARYLSGAPAERETDVAYWTDWVRRRMHHVREMTEHRVLLNLTTNGTFPRLGVDTIELKVAAHRAATLHVPTTKCWSDRPHGLE